MSGRSNACNKAIAETTRLTAAGVLGFYTHFEATEIFAVRDGDEKPLNIFSILVTEERTGDVSTKPRYPGKRIKLKELKGWIFGVIQTVKPISDLLPALEALSNDAEWQISGERLYFGTLTPAPTQFVPPDSTIRCPWNRVLKNNFWNGSHIIEWADSKKTELQPLFDSPPTLQKLSHEIRRSVPIELASLSDRLGNVAVQLPVTVIMSRFDGSRVSGNCTIDVAWHEKAVARDLRASSERQFDLIISGYTTGVVQEPRTVLPIGAGGGVQRSIVWDEINQVVLSSSGDTGFMTNIGANIEIRDPEPRTFSAKNKDGQVNQIRIELCHLKNVVVRSSAKDWGEEWTRKRIYRDEVARLAAERKFVQYRPNPGQQLASHEKAMEDIRYLLNRFGEDGVFLWDPYLSADDLLNTLFYIKYWNADLRAMTEGNTIPGETGSLPFVEAQRAILAGSRSNFRGLRLEYRIRTGQAGWAFHDRFLIFPRDKAGALAWSLGTSVNSLGKQHHILQQVDDGQLVADAFNDLWNELDLPEHLVWKKP
jgi:hypothetical protein